jgi:hypothetical protein
MVRLLIFTTATGTQTMYLLANTGTAVNFRLYTIGNFTATGTATLVGTIGNGIAVRDIALAAGTGLATAGPHALLLNTGSLKAGLYFVRLLIEGSPPPRVKLPSNN